MSSNRNVGIVGVGPELAGWMPTLQTYPNLSIVGVCETDPELTGRFCAHFGVPPCDGIPGLLQLAPEIIVVATPPPAHLSAVREIVRHAQMRPLVLMVASPLVSDEGDLDEMVTIGQQDGVAIVPMLELSYGAVTWLNAELWRIGELQHVDALLETEAISMEVIPTDRPRGAGMVLLPQLLEVVFSLTGWLPFGVAATAHDTRSRLAEDILAAYIKVGRPGGDRSHPISVTARVEQGAEAGRLTVSLRGASGIARIESCGDGDDFTLRPTLRFFSGGCWLGGPVAEPRSGWPTRAQAKVELLRDTLQALAAMGREERMPDGLPDGLPRLLDAATGLSTVFRCYDAAGVPGRPTGSP